MTEDSPSRSSPAAPQTERRPEAATPEVFHSEQEDRGRRVDNASPPPSTPLHEVVFLKQKTIICCCYLSKEAGWRYYERKSDEEFVPLRRSPPRSIFMEDQMPAINKRSYSRAPVLTADEIKIVTKL